MINGIGIDTLFKPRLYRLLSRRHNSMNRLSGRILTLNEQNDLNSRTRSLDYKLNYLGVRYATVFNIIFRQFIQFLTLDGQLKKQPLKHFILNLNQNGKI